MTVFLYKFTNCDYWHAFNKKQLNGSYLDGLLLTASTKNQLVDLVRERIKKTKKIIVMNWDGSQFIQTETL